MLEHMLHVRYNNFHKKKISILLVKYIQYRLNALSTVFFYFANTLFEFKRRYASPKV